jgi:1-pyrroline-5-carboxylate dehydrogenase
MAGLLFTGSSQVFTDMYKKIGTNMEIYKNYPRLVGETGGKNFHFIDYSCDFKKAFDMTFESAFNYSGQKCSACSRLYLPVEHVDKLIKHFKNYSEKIQKQEYGLISNESYEKANLNLKYIRDTYSVRTFGGNANNYSSYYFEPTLIIDENHNDDIFNKEFFAPILAVYPYRTTYDGIEKCKKQNMYSLTGSIFSDDINTIIEIKDSLSHECGNLYINQKSTGAVVGQQPFGGFRKSGTNDKAGDINILYRVCNQKNTKILI